jgi:Ca2+-binding RTX toxin-like protein
MSYFGRPADFYGLQSLEKALDALKAPTTAEAITAAYRTNPAIKSLLDSFSASPESQALYTGNDAQFINAIYNNVLNRDADVPGLNFWVNALTSGAMTRAQAAQNILAAAVREGGNAADKALVESKITLANDFTTALGASAATITAYSGDTAAQTARDLFHGVTADTTSAAFAEDIAATLDTLVANATPSNSVSLTTSVDALTGTSANDTFNAIIGGSDPTLNALDSINGGAGTNTLNVKGAAAVAAGDLAALGLTLSNVQNLAVSATAGVALNAADTAGFKSVATTVGAAVATVIAADDATTVSATGGTTVGITAAKAATVTVTNASGAVTIGSDALTTLNLNKTGGAVGVTAAAATRTLTINTNGVTAGGVTDATATTVVVNNTRADSTIDLAVGAAKTLTLGGSKELTIGTLAAGNATKATIVGAGGVVADLSGAAKVTAVDASASTGANHIAVDAAKASYTGGSGADTVSIAAKAAFAIDGGAGTSDVLELNAAAFDFGDKVTGFEVLGLGAAATGDYKVGSFTQLQTGETTAAVSFSSVAANSTLTITEANTHGVTVNLANISGTADVLNLVVSGDATIAAGTVTAAGVETVNITATDTTGDAAAVHTLTLAAADATKLTVGGDTAITLTTTASDKIATFTSTNTEGVTYVSTNTTTAVSITGGAGDDHLTSASGSTKVATIDGGAGDDVIVGGGGKDVLLGGAGDDTITGGAAADALTGGDGNDVFNYVATTDSTASAADTITGFTAATADAEGDVISFANAAFGGAIGSFNVSVVSNGTLALAALGSAAHTANVVNVVLDSSTGTLYIDGTGSVAGTSDGTVDMAIVLTGVTTLTADAFAHA